jgi:serine/threonine protein phosphatase PrpC
VSKPEETPSWSAPASITGPSLSFGFNLGKIPDHGEDADPILRDGPDLGLVGVFDGMGGAGGTVYETPEGPRTGAYLASRIARDVVERRMLDLLEPDWNLNGRAAAEDLRRSVRKALEAQLVELKAPTSRLRSRLLRALPTTMSIVALQRTQRAGSTWACHVFWAGDSRSYVFTVDGARQLHPDDLRDPRDAMANLRHDSVVSNAMSADTDFVVNYRRVDLTAPFLIVSATDGCFGYLPTPMHFEHLVLGALAAARTADDWSEAVQARVTAVTGDDAAMVVMGVGADLDAFSTLFAPRLAALDEAFIAPLDRLSQSVQDAELALEAARTRHRDETAALWSHYQSGYERFLRPESAEEPAAPDHEADALRTPVDGNADAVEEQPEDDSGVVDPDLGRLDEVSL